MKANGLFLLYLKLYFLCVLDFLFYFLLYCNLTHFIWFHNTLYQEKNVKIPCLKERKFLCLQQTLHQEFYWFFSVLNLKQFFKCAFYLLMNDTCLTTIVIVNIDYQVESLNHHGNKPLGRFWVLRLYKKMREDVS